MNKSSRCFNGDQHPHLREDRPVPKISAKVMLIDLLQGSEISKLDGAKVHGYVLEVFVCPLDGLLRIMESPEDYAICYVSDRVFQSWRTSQNIRELIAAETWEYGICLKFFEGLSAESELLMAS